MTNDSIQQKTCKDRNIYSSQPVQSVSITELGVLLRSGSSHIRTLRSSLLLRLLALGKCSIYKFRDGVKLRLQNYPLEACYWVGQLHPYWSIMIKAGCVALLASPANERCARAPLLIRTQDLPHLKPSSSLLHNSSIKTMKILWSPLMFLIGSEVSN